MNPLRPVVALLAGSFAATAIASDAPDFTREVRPLLSRYCFKCHGPDDKTRKGGLRLDQRDSAMKPARSGDIAIVPGKPDESEFLVRIFSEFEDDVMPPPETKQTLTPEQKDIFKRWIAAGAPYEEHWAFVPPKEPAIPQVKNTAWAKTPIDRFILARLEAEGVQPSPTADPYTLVRRTYLDLIGIPPTPEEAEQFAAAAARNIDSAIADLADRLLARPQYGERWARRWLDLARYADTNGYEKDRERSIWPYRDWVIRALNADMPFDQFTIEQIAGDLLPNPTLDQLIATGFHRNTMLNEEGGIDPLEFRFHAMTDRVATTGTTWLGLTVGCAQCHTHKYDPITHREYFQFMAFLNNADEPELPLPDPDAEQAHKKNLERAAKLLAELPQKWPLDEGQWQALKPSKIETAHGGQGKPLADGSVLFSGPSPEREIYTIAFDAPRGPFGRIRLETLTHDSLPSKGPGRVAHGNFVLNELALSLVTPDGKATPLQIKSATADVEQANFPITGAFDGNTKTGWAVHKPGNPLNTDKHATFTLDREITAPAGSRIVAKLDQTYGNQHTIGRLRLTVPNVSPDPRLTEVRRREAVEKRFAQWLSEERKNTVNWIPLKPAAAKANLPFLTVQNDASIFVSGDTSKDDTYELKFTNVPRGITAIRLEVLPDDRLPARGPGMAYYEGPKGDFLLNEFILTVGGKPVKFARTSESFGNTMAGKTGAALTIDGDRLTGWTTNGRQGERDEAVYVPEQPINAGAFDLTMHFGRHYAASLGRFRISVTTAPNGAQARNVDENIARLIALPDAQLTADQRAQLREHFLLTAQELAAHAKEIHKLRRPPATPTTLVMRERPPQNPRPTFIHNRGEFLQPTDPVEPGVLSVLNQLPPNAPRNRLTFARWLVSPENPLTARVTVNRAWADFFARGIVPTTQDFGLQGEAPSHPELLDWLAIEFMRQGWSMKKLHRLIVTSAVYRQSSAVTPEQLKRDPQNVLLARAPRPRLEAEVLRDTLLHASGILSFKAFGPGVNPPQPGGVTEVAYGGPKWNASKGEDRYRRSIYTFIKRTAPFAMYQTFDAPSGEACVARRDSSNTPLQALTLLNDVMFVEATQAFGQKLAMRNGDVESRIRHAFQRTLTRPPTDREVASLKKFLDNQRQRLIAGELDAKTIAGPGEGDPVERAVWTTLARALFNLDETVIRS